MLYILTPKQKFKLKFWFYPLAVSVNFLYVFLGIELGNGFNIGFSRCIVCT